ncbi:hypothetical protein PIB30_107563, partial [Stylosanthes scabra]|nr:hypothetical protein [Stylosanthes scabra]
MANLLNKPAVVSSFFPFKKTPVPKPNSAPKTTASTAVSATVSGGLRVVQQLQLDPFSVGDDIISKNIIGIHDAQAVRQDVDSLFNVVSNIVRSSTNVAGSLDLK